MFYYCELSNIINSNHIIKIEKQNSRIGENVKNIKRFITVNIFLENIKNKDN